ncbi:MAG: 16S rRNA (guanine(966)-N(2))-methyltransferase RsmD [Rhodospirillales bacterium]|nr:16S rRNA (guanine(966)-N(2))-methyltransferase RsmD [Rhodospirillales bacterium]MDE2318598.1 16S rRNA (guanine(966)-N(2))-methyltransferase RsmD [Rhodospirillales bacterium]
MRIIAGRWKGRVLAAPTGQATRPTNIRARQAVFDILAHAPWCELQGAKVLDVFAGTGAYGLEALSRGAASASFIELAIPALAVLKTNITVCKADAARIVPADALRPPEGAAHDLVFLDPPYGQALVAPSLAALAAKGWIAPGAVIVAELGPGEALDVAEPLAERAHGKARLKIWRYPG